MPFRDPATDQPRQSEADTTTAPAPWRRLLLLFIVLALAIIAAGITIFEIQQRAITDDAFESLAALQKHEQRELAAWLRDRQIDVRQVTDNPTVFRALSGAMSRSDAWPHLVEHLRQMIGARYRSAVVFDAHGAIQLRVGDTLVDQGELTALAHQAMRERRPVFGDTVASSAKRADLDLLVVAPVVARGEAVAAVGFQLDPDYLEAILAEWSGPKSSRELLLVRLHGNQVYYLSAPKFGPPDEVQVVRGHGDLIASQTGERLRGRDYRNVRTLGVSTPVPGTPWKLVSKIDEAEPFAAIRKAAMWITAVTLALVAGTGGIIFSWWRKERADHLVARYEAELRRRALESHYDYLARFANDPILLADAEGRILECNERAVEFYGYTRDELARMRMSDLSAPAHVLAYNPLADASANEQAAVYETVHRTKDGRFVVVEVSARTIRIDGRVFRQATIRDITERKRADEQIRRLTYLYAALSQINATLIRSQNRETLFADICRLAVEYGHFDSACIGLLDASGQRLERAARFGRTEHTELVDFWGSQGEARRGRGPVATALREGRVAIDNELRGDDEHEQMLLEQAGIRAGAALPLHIGERMVGIMAIYSNQTEVFDPEITRLLEGMADDVSFALEAFERDAQRERAEQATRESEARYRQLVGHMSSGVAVYEPVGQGEDFVVREANGARERIERLSREELIGRRLSALYADATVVDVLDAARAVWRRGAARHLPTLLVEGRGWREIWFYTLPSGELVEVCDDVTVRMEAQEALRRSQERLALVLKGSNDGYWDFNYETGEVYYSRRWASMLGYPLEEIDHSLDGWAKLVHPEDLPDVRHHLEDHWAGRSPDLQMELRMRHKDGRYVWILMRGRVVRRDAQGKPLRMAGTHTEISAQKQQEEQLRLWGTVFASSGEAIFITDAEARIISANAAFTQITGYTESEVIGKNPRILSSGEHDRAFYQNLWATLETVGHWQGEIRDRRKNGEAFPMWTAITAVRDAQGRLRNYIAICSDISERKAAEERIRYLAQHDALTGLPNRALLQDRLELGIAHAQRTSVRTAVLFVDIDRFKNVNDSLGHHFGDELLKLVGERLKGGVRVDDTVSRQGGDEFLLVLTDLHEISDAAHVAQKIIDLISKPFVVEETEIHVTISVGIAVSPDDGADTDTLIRNADAAMYYAKERGRNNYQFFTPELNKRALARITLENSLRRAVDHGDFVLHYQPQMHIASGQLVGVEALLRWRKEGQLVAPAGFIGVAEDTGLILPIGAWVLREACRQQREWKQAGLPPLPVAVNVSATQFHQKDVLPVLRTMVSESCIDPEALEVELTESTIMEDAESSIAILRGLKDLGIRLAIDDFGTGYSSLNYLRRFPIDRLKVDQSFVHDLETDPADRAITEAIIALAKTLGLKVIAEGVERSGEIELLRERHCDELQGFYLSPPLPADEFLRWWRKRMEPKT